MPKLLCVVLKCVARMADAHTNVKPAVTVAPVLGFSSAPVANAAHESVVSTASCSQRGRIAIGSRPCQRSTMLRHGSDVAIRTIATAHERTI